MRAGPGSGKTDNIMPSDRKPPSANAAQGRAPEWADGLKQLYDSVVEEDLPDSFKNLLAQLDEIEPRRGSNDKKNQHREEKKSQWLAFQLIRNSSLEAFFQQGLFSFFFEATRKP